MGSALSVTSHSLACCASGWLATGKYAVGMATNISFLFGSLVRCLARGARR